MILTIIIIVVVMVMIWWTWAATWRSPPPPRPPLQIIIAIIIVTFYSIFFCCSIWTLIRVCVGHSPSHPTFIIVSLLKARGLPPRSEDVRTATFEDMGLREGGGLRNVFTSWTSIESVHFSSSSYPPLLSILLSVLSWYLQSFFGVVTVYF